MPIMAAQLVLVTAAESHSLIVDGDFALKLPLAASGMGEPLVSAAGILGVMAVWRTFYAGFLDWSFFLSLDTAHSSRPQEQMQAWWDAVRIMLYVCGAGSIVAFAAHVLTQSKP
jgi:hypothetical protein